MKYKRAVKIAVKITSGLLYAVLFLVLAYNIYNLIARVVFKQDLPKLFGTAGAVVVSGSMHPAIEVGDMVIIKEQDGYKVGDIVTFREGNMMITHRIIDSTPGGFITKGDSNTGNDGEITLDRIEGKVIAVIPKIGLALGFLQSPLGMLVLVIAGLLLILMPYAVQRVKKRKVKELDEK